MAAQAFLYQQTADAIRKRIASGDLKPGDQVGPSIPEMAKAYGVGEGTMRSALRLLGDRGLIETRQGVRTTVTADGQSRAQDNGLEATVRKMQEDIAGLKADVAELQSQRNIGRAARKQVRGNEQSG